MARKINFSRVREGEPYSAPIRARKGDAGLDLSVSRYMQVFPGQNAHLSTNIRVEIPPGTFGLILPRSSTLWHKGLHISPGIVDSGYRGEVMILAHNPTDSSVHVGVRDRVAQLLLLPEPGWEFVETEELSEGSRGDAGFGSTGA